MHDLTAVRIDPGGWLSDVILPGEGRTGALRRELGGWPEYAHYGRDDTAVCLIVHETGLTDGMDANWPAVALAEHMRGGPLSYPLCGPVLALGYLPGTDTLVSLPSALRDVLHGLAPRHDAA